MISNWEFVDVWFFLSFLSCNGLLLVARDTSDGLEDGPPSWSCVVYWSDVAKCSTVTNTQISRWTVLCDKQQRIREQRHGEKSDTSQIQISLVDWAPHCDISANMYWPLFFFLSTTNITTTTTITKNRHRMCLSIDLRCRSSVLSIILQFLQLHFDGCRISPRNYSSTHLSAQTGTLLRQSTGVPFHFRDVFFFMEKEKEEEWYYSKLCA